MSCHPPRVTWTGKTKNKKNNNNNEEEKKKTEQEKKKEKKRKSCSYAEPNCLSGADGS